MTHKRWIGILSAWLILGFAFSSVQTVSVTANPIIPTEPPAFTKEPKEPRDKIEPLVLHEISQAAETNYFIWINEKADLTPAYGLKTKTEKGRFVFETLRETAESTQKELRAYLEGQDVKYQSFYIANKILVYGGSQELALNIASRSDVGRITANHEYQLQQPFIDPSPSEYIASIGTNISFINADDVWATGVTGQGTVMAGNDTGLQWDHPAIINQYRGWNGGAVDHNYNWWDATGTYQLVPGDGHGHGTHTTGTMVGDDGGANQIGVAPGAKTIHCKNMTNGGGGNDYTFSTCFQWDLAPWDLNGLNPQPDLAPDAINNSWGYWGGNSPQFEDEIEALQAAGILVEVSAGNEGPSCATLRSPSDYEQVLTTGSINHAGGSLPGTLTGFSSRGPSDLYPADLIPDVMAPGQNIYSSIPGSGYQGGWSGTSMAGPHTTALIGLLWSANPGLQGMVAETIEIINSTAVRLTGETGSNCGGDYTDGPNNDWGHGTIDALAAVEMAILFGGSGAQEGTVTDSSNSEPIDGALIQAAIDPSNSWTMLTDQMGYYSRWVLSGTYTVTTSAYGYNTAIFNNVVVTEDVTTTLDIELDAAPLYLVDGYVTDAITGWPLYARIGIDGYPRGPIWTDPVSGYYSVTLAAGIPYTFDVSAWVPEYLIMSRDIDPLTGNITENFSLEVDAVACEAPGYKPTLSLDNDFDPGGFADGWTVINNGGDCVWRDDDPGYIENDTGGSGIFAIVDSDYCGASGYMDTELRSPTFDVSGMSSVTMMFNSDFPYLWTGNDVLDVDVWDGGAWTNVLRRTGVEYPGPETVTIDITAEAGGFTDAQMRFHYYNANYDWWWAVDDVKIIGDCVPPANGGLVVGNVYDNNTGDPLNGAEVTNESDWATWTLPIPDDPLVDDSFFTIFSPAGSQEFIVTMDEYNSDIEYPSVVEGGTIKQDFFLSAVPAPTASPTPTYTPTLTPTDTPPNTATPTQEVTPTSTNTPTPTATAESPNLPEITFVLPSQSQGGLPNEINIYGASFQPGAVASMESTLPASLVESVLNFIGLDSIAESALVTTFINEGHLRAVVPADISAGTYDFTVANPDGGQTTLQAGYTVLEAGADDLYGYDYELWTNPTALRAGESAQVGLVVHRLGGTSTLTNVTVSFYLDDPGPDGTHLGDGVIPLLSPDSSDSTTGVSWSLPEAGDYSIYAVIDPGGVVPETLETNNVIHLLVTILPPAQDQAPPTVDEFNINAGEIETIDQEVTLFVSASDPAIPAPSSGMQAVFAVEYEYYEGAAIWLPVQFTDWMEYTTTPSAFNWTLMSSAGVKYLQVWVVDSAGNISLSSLGALTNHMLPVDSLFTGASRYYVYPMDAGQTMTANLTPTSGDPDMYIWPPSGGTPWYSINGEGEDEVILVAPEDGWYTLQVYGYAAAEYSFSVEISSLVAASVPVTEPPSNQAKVPLSNPGLVPDQIPETGIPYALPPAPIQPDVPMIFETSIFLPVVVR